jgi:actin-like protein 6A
MGSSTVKAGHAGEDTPKAFFPTPCGVIFPQVDEGKSSFVGKGEMGDNDCVSSSGAAFSPADTAAQMMANRRIFTGHEQDLFRDGQEIMTPIQHGLIMDWDAVESIWEYTFKNRLRSDPRNHPILMSEPVYNTQSRREKTVELMFESLQTPAFYLAKDAVLSAFSQGRPTALVVSSGAGATTVVPVYDGYVLHKATLKTKVAGDSVDALVQRLVFAPKGIADIPAQFEWRRHPLPGGGNAVSRVPLVGEITASFRAYAQQQVIRQLKESLCRCHDQAFDTEVYARIPARPFLLPDGKVLDIGVERMIVGEAYFDPALGLGQEVVEDLDPGYQFPGLHHMVCNAVDLCDVDVRKDLYSSVVLTGGNTLMKDIHVRLQKEVNALLPLGLRARVNVPPVTAERQFATWIGGSVLTTLGTFHQLWLSKEEYDEYGSSIVLRKCP